MCSTATLPPGWGAWLPFLLLSFCGGQTSRGGADASVAASGSSASGPSRVSGMSSGMTSGMMSTGMMSTGTTSTGTTSTGTISTGMPADAAAATGVAEAAAGGSPDAAGSCNSCEAFCAGQCIDVLVDPKNCGACGVRCSGQTPHCLYGKCTAPPCDGDAAACGAGTTCCGVSCCDSTQVCCQNGQSGGSGVLPYCQTPSATDPFACPAVCCAEACGSSDRNLKRDIRPVDVEEVLRSLSEVPVSTWAYKADPDTRHMGPMAQDFYAAFGLGNSDRFYHPIDAHGVAFAAIQALYQRLIEQERRIDALERDRDKCAPRDPARPK